MRWKSWLWVLEHPGVALEIAPRLARIAPYTMAPPEALAKLYRLGRDVVRRGIAGDFVECGVCRGGSAAAIAGALRGSGRNIWLSDSLAGLPPATPRDGPAAASLTGACWGSVEAVREAMRLAGWFADTLPQPGPRAVSLLHIDADWYDSVTLALDDFYDRVSEGGIILLDDFGHWEGRRQAFYDFIARRGLRPLLERFGHTQAFWIKGREHNREFWGQWEIPAA